ncbi:MAG: hypothetical protein DMG57_41335, partial [Acidobacteria bacterium]
MIRAGTEEVLLDVIVRDKKGRPIHDLEADDIEVYEDGARQKVTAFRLVEGARQETEASEAEPALSAKTEQKHSDPTRQLRLVSLVFDSLNEEARRLARLAALEFLKNPLDQNAYIAVFTIDLRLNVLQQFTNDRDLLRKAIGTATTKQYTDFSAQSDAIRKELEDAEQDVNGAESASSPGRGNSSSGGIGSGMAAAAMASMTLNVLRNAETTTREQQARSAIFSLLSIIREQAALPGRKTVLYFCEGLAVPEATIEQFRSVISAANRANVSVYDVDARGLISDAQSKSSTAMLASAAKSSRRQQIYNNSVTVDQVKVFDTARDSIHADRQTALDDLSTSTGGFLIANTNDFRAPFRKLSE